MKRIQKIDNFINQYTVKEVNYISNNSERNKYNFLYLKNRMVYTKDRESNHTGFSLLLGKDKFLTNLKIKITNKEVNSVIFNDYFPLKYNKENDYWYLDKINILIGRIHFSFFDKDDDGFYLDKKIEIWGDLYFCNYDFLDDMKYKYLYYYNNCAYSKSMNLIYPNYYINIVKSFKDLCYLIKNKKKYIYLLDNKN